MNKTYTCSKTGYSAGLHGCSAEYFTTTIMHNGEIVHQMLSNGLYGIEESIRDVLDEAGYKYQHVNNNWGKLSYREGTKYSHGENDSIEQLKKWLSELPQ